jgi:hypothetical protein
MSEERPPFSRRVGADGRPHPSEEREAFWLYARNETPTGRPEDRERSGKWLVFVPKERLDEVWEVLWKETEAGRLGCRTKVSTAARNPAQVVLDERNGVISVFTYDHRDEADLRRVRARLRELGFRDKLAYKTNRATRERRYGDPSDLSVHLRYE